MAMTSSTTWWRKYDLKHTFYTILLGQMVSLTFALATFASSLVASLGVDAPLTLTLFNYLSLALIFGGIMIYRRRKLLIPWYWYLILGFVDVQAAYLLNKAFQYSSITSVTILDCWTVPWVIILTWIVFGTRYSLWQYLGAALCMTGLCLVLLSDSGVGGRDASRPLLGDFLVIASTLFYAVSNVSEEFCVKKKDLIEVLSMLGVFGTLVSVCEIFVVERKSLESVEWSTEIILAFVVYTAALFMVYTFLPFVLQMSGSTMLNLSFLTSDMWAVVFRIFFYHQEVDWLYYVSFAIVVVGLVIYSTTGNDPTPMPPLEDADLNGQYHVLNGENSILETRSQIHEA